MIVLHVGMGDGRGGRSVRGRCRHHLIVCWRSLLWLHRVPVCAHLLFLLLIAAHVALTNDHKCPLIPCKSHRVTNISVRYICARLRPVQVQLNACTRARAREPSVCGPSEGNTNTSPPIINYSNGRICRYKWMRVSSLSIWSNVDDDDDHDGPARELKWWWRRRRNKTTVTLIKCHKIHSNCNCSSLAIRQTAGQPAVPSVECRLECSGTAW